ncbi:MAG TPA: multicopper oxidase family protein [Verrucomicrobiae bacterium]|nr:multicopper oxidase family protein [Verrucomicrobiae bacterium]
MNRSGFLAASAGAATAFALPQLAAPARAQEVVDFSLVAAPLEFRPGPGLAYPSLAYNGRLPGPLLRVTLGQRVRVRFTNRTPIETSVHWHGQIPPNDMDGVAGITQPPVLYGESFLYEFAPNPPGTRWYHDHAFQMGALRGLFGLFVIDDPKDEPADAEFALVFHDVPKMDSVKAAMRGTSTAPMFDPMGSPEMAEMQPGDKMGDEVDYAAHCIDGGCYPSTTPLAVKVGDRVRLRILNASPTQTRYVRLAGHRLRITHADGNPLAKPLEVDALRVGVAERYDAWFEVAAPGAWLLEGISSDPLAYQQAAVVHTQGMERAAPVAAPQSLEGVEYSTYVGAGGTAASVDESGVTQRYDWTLDGGAYGERAWTIDGKSWPNTPKIIVNRGDRVLVRFTNHTDMDHPMHLHGHTFRIVSVNGKALARPLAKDVSLVPANGGTLTWIFDADSPKGRWLLHCHNDVHMMDGMMTEVRYA